MTRTPRRRQVCDLLPPSIADDMLRFSAEAGGQLPAAAAIERWASACGLFLVYVRACACVRVRASLVSALVCACCLVVRARERWRVSVRRP